MLIDEFIKEVDERDRLVEEHFGDKMLELLENPEERMWYNHNISPIDEKIVRIANKIMRKEFDAITTTFIRIIDVYKSQELIELYKDRKEELKEIADGNEEKE